MAIAQQTQHRAHAVEEFTRQYKLGLGYFEREANEAYVLNRAIFTSFLTRDHVMFQGEQALSVLDIGVSTGMMSAQFVRGLQSQTAQRLTYTIVEPDAAFVAETCRRLPPEMFVDVIPQPLQKALDDLRGHQYDIILASHSFYHFGPSYVIDLAQLLSPGGSLLVILSSPKSASRHFLEDSATATSVLMADVLACLGGWMQSSSTMSLTWEHVVTTSQLQLPQDARRQRALFTFLCNRLVHDCELATSIQQSLVEGGWSESLTMEYELLCVH
jgi:phospholipid N-methyltransferase